MGGLSGHGQRSLGGSHHSKPETSLQDGEPLAFAPFACSEAQGLQERWGRPRPGPALWEISSLKCLILIQRKSTAEGSSSLQLQAGLFLSFLFQESN